jgi:Protein of unknown function (DUF559)
MPVDEARYAASRAVRIDPVSRPPAPLPRHLRGRVFTVAEAREASVSPHRLEAADLVRPSWGLRAERLASTCEEHARGMRAVIPPPFAYSHITAARLWRLPLPTAWNAREPLHVMRDGTPLRRRGIQGHRGLANRTVVTVRGLPVSSEVDTWADLAAGGGLSVDDLVVAGDAFASRTPELLPALVAASSAAGGRGRRSLREAGSLLRCGSGSPRETLCRLGFLRAGLPEPELNAEVLGEDGQFVARVDFLWTEARVVVEYEGDHHRTDRRQWQNDIARTRMLEALGYRVIRVTAADLSGRRWDELVTLLRSFVG